MAPDRPSTLLALSALCLLAFALRAYGVSWGLPDFLFLDSHRFFVKPALALVIDGEWKVQQFLHTPTLVYVLAALYAPARVLGIDDLQAEGRLGAEVLSVVWIGRWLIVVLSTLQVPLVYAVGRRLFGPRAALLAAALLAVLPLPILESHRINADLPMVLVVLLAMWAALNARDSTRPRRLMASFALAGGAAAVKLPGLAIVTVPAWIAATWPGAPWGRRVRWIVLGGLVALATLATFISPMLLSLSEFVESLSHLGNVGFQRGRPGANLEGDQWFYIRYLYWLVAGLPFALGWAVYLVALGGLVRLASTRHPSAGIMAAAMIPFFLVQGLAVTVEPRYFLYLSPFLTLAAGFAIDGLWARRAILGRAVFLIVFLYTTVLSASLDLRIGAEPQMEVGRILDRLAAREDLSPRLRVAYPARYWLNWDPIQAQLRDRHIRIIPFPSRRRAQSLERWAEEMDIDVIIVSSQVGGTFERSRRHAPFAPFLRRLQTKASGFTRIADVSPRFFTDRLYTWSDPMRATSLQSGVMGYEIFLRTTLASPFRSATESTPVPR